MNTRFQSFTPAGNALLLALGVALLAACGGGGGGSSPPPSIALSGTVATGRALPNAGLSIVCAQGSASTTTNASGAFQSTLSAAAPCLITATSGNTVLHSTAFAGGTFNVTPETELLLVYVAAQLGTTEGTLIANFPHSAQFQQTLANESTVLNAQAAVVQGLDTQYHLTLSAPNFLTTAFVVGQPGVDSDLETLLAAGAIDSNGEPDPVAVTLMMTLGAQHPLPPPPVTPPGTTGGTGTGTGGGVGMM
ncbi:hypothetical protein FAZ95_27745 [Trinickia violacea]|uniref:Carboxypeptidase regulatory-like domain-containing protein n=1 Tax=Trinickia violacea TaxID=2571746 RepID=A0A4P8IZ93_9BURK|nr:hypothetical protein [Trinickia violacea]QCP52903.1 hypothetical protein FAZ95_27745 [Trinickia violacea]